MKRDDDAVQVDSYLDDLLLGRVMATESIALAAALAHTATDEHEAEEIREAATLVHRALPRFHPSFAFEERLARRLRSPDSAHGAMSGVVLPFAPPHDSTVHRPDVPDPSGEGRPSTESQGRPEPFPGSGIYRRTRGVLLGGAIASGVSIAGVSLAGAALRARRRSRPTASVL